MATLKVFYCAITFTFYSTVLQATGIRLEPNKSDWNLARGEGLPFSFVIPNTTEGEHSIRGVVKLYTNDSQTPALTQDVHLAGAPIGSFSNRSGTEGCGYKLMRIIETSPAGERTHTLLFRVTNTPTSTVTMMEVTITYIVVPQTNTQLALPQYRTVRISWRGSGTSTIPASSQNVSTSREPINGVGTHKHSLVHTIVASASALLYTLVLRIL